MNTRALVVLVGITLLWGCHRRGVAVSEVEADAGTEGAEAPVCAQNGGCDPNAVCAARGHTRVCICNSWYFGDGQTCTRTALQPGSPWPVEGGNVGHTGQSPHVGPQTSHVKWALKMEGGGRASPVIDADGTVYIGALRNFHAYNPDGTLKWTFTEPTTFGWSTPALGGNGLIYLHSDWNLFLAIDTASSPAQRVRWSYETGDAFLNPPILGPDGTVYVASQRTGTSDGQFYAFDAVGTTPKRTFPSGGVNGSSPTLGRDGTLYLPNENGTLFAVTPEFTQKWSTSLSEVVAGTSAIIGSDGTVFVGTSNGSVSAINPTTGAAQSIKIADRIRSLAFGADGSLYAGTYDRRLLAVRYSGGWRTDWKKWTFVTEDRVGGIALGADGTIYASAETLYAINPDGTLKWKADTITNPIGTPAIASDGTLYIQDGLGNLYAFGQ